MDWFKHYCSASRNKMLVKIERDHGLVGYARYWKILELIAEEMKASSDRCEVDYHLNDWATFLKGKPNKVATFLEYLANVPGIFVERTGNVFKIKIPKLLELRDSRNRARHARGSIDKEVDKEEEKSKSKPASPASPEGPKEPKEKKPKASKTYVPQEYLDARDTGTWPIKDMEGLIKAASKYGFEDRYAWAMFVDFVNKKEASGYQAKDWVAAFRNQCDGVKNKGWDGPKGRMVIMDDPGAGHEEYMRKQAEETKQRMDAGYYD